MANLLKMNWKVQNRTHQSYRLKTQWIQVKKTLSIWNMMIQVALQMVKYMNCLMQEVKNKKN